MSSSFMGDEALNRRPKMHKPNFHHWKWLNLVGGAGVILCLMIASIGG